MVIDAHQHFWQYNPTNHAWIDDNMQAIRKNFLPSDLLPILQENEVNGCITVQVDQTEAETEGMINVAAQNSFIKGVVGWVDLQAQNVEERLNYYQQFSILKGIRHIVQGQPKGFMLQPKFLNGIKALLQVNFTYDILIYPNQLEEAMELVKKNPNQLFVIDHLAKPYIKAGLIHQWKKDIETIAQLENVYCKISGLVTEAEIINNSNLHQFTPYLQVATNAFGTNRIMFGSDWPVCLVAATYKKVMNIAKEYFATFSKTEQEHIFGLNAIKFYNIK